MHRALQIVDILAHIIQCLEEKTHKRRTAVALARTCRAFYEPASDHLWEDLPRLSYLFTCVRDNFNSNLNMNSGQERQLSDPVWPRILANAGRVKTLTFSCADGACLDRHIPMINLMRANSTRGIFPNLRALSIGESTSGFDDRPTTEQLSIVLSPDIREITIHQGPEDESGGTVNVSVDILPFIIRSCPHLEVVTLNDCPGREAVDMLWTLDSLKRVECTLHGEGTSEFWEAEFDLVDLACAPALSYLSVSAPWDFGDGAWWQTHYEPMTFPSLKTLELSSFPYESTIVDLLEKLDAPLLHELEIGDLDKIEGEDAFIPLLGLLAKYPQLRVLKIHGHGIDEPLTLQPSLKLCGLEELEINILDALDQSFISELAQACPQLRRLVAYTGPHDYPYPWGLEALAECAASMPRLEYLHTEFYTADVGELEEPTARSLVPITIMVGKSRLAEENEEKVATYIAKIYPNAAIRVLPSLQWDDTPDSELSEPARRWRRVSRAVAEVGRLASSDAADA